MKNKKQVQLWGFLAILTVLPVVGAICAIYHHSAAMFYASLIAIPLVAIAFPAAMFVLNVLPFLVARMIYLTVMPIRRLFSSKGDKAD